MSTRIAVCLSIAFIPILQSAKSGLRSHLSDARLSKPKRALNFVERTLQHFVFTRNAETHVVVVDVTVGECAAWHSPHPSLTDQHLVEPRCILEARWDACPYVKGRS